MQLSSLAWSRFAYLGGIVLALVLFIPDAYFPTQLGKVSAFALLTAVSALLLAWGGGARTLVRAHGFYAAMLVGLLPLAYLVSAFGSVNPAVAWTGYALDVDTVLFTTLAFVAFIFAFVHFRTLRTLQLLVLSLGAALALAALVQYGSIFFGFSLVGGEDRSANLLGKWNDLGLMVGLLALMLLVRAELGVARGGMRPLAIAGLALLMVLLAFINFTLVWGLLLVGAGVVATVAYLSVREGGKRPVLSAAVAACAGLFLLFGATFNNALTSVFPISALEVRPALSSTVDVVSASYNKAPKRFFTGMGPNTFAQQWMLYKPAEVNQSQFWNLDFSVGFSTLATALLSVGVVGLVAWMMPLLLVLAGVVRAVRRSVLSHEDRAAGVSIALAALFAYAMLAFYVPSQNLVLLAFVLSGAAFGFLWRQGRQAPSDAPAGRVQQVAMLATVGVLLALSVLAATASVRHLTAQVYLGQGQAALAAADAGAALAAADSSVRAKETSAGHRLAVDAGVLRLSQLAQESSPSASQQSEFATIARDTLAHGAQAIALAPQDYRGYASVGAAYSLLASLRVEGAYASAKTAYAKAAELNPTSPAIPLLFARLEAEQGNSAAVRTHLQKALVLKPNYTDAMLFSVQLAVVEDDLPQALRSAEAAAASAPGVAPIWFQLGLLHYAGGNLDRAIAPLERAVLLAPQYANAKYFLGISYYAEDRTQEAIRLFEELEQTNPSSQEVRTILENMRAGKPALETLPPEEPTEAPLSE